MIHMDSRERARVEEQLGVLELLDAAMGRRDEVFEIVESSENSEEAQERIRELFAVRNPHIARAVLDVQVGRWTRSGRREMSDRVEELRRLLSE